ncbi:Uncharacterised protein [Staphylococcus saprophyticus]|nr:Uncharacterised protein [Staphylococcus saprophyticus]
MAVWISLIGMWFCIGMAFLVIKVSKNRNNALIYR